MGCQLIILDKQPNMHPVSIGESYQRLMAKCDLHTMGHQATAAAGNLNLCTGLQASIEGAIHALGDALLDASNPPEEPLLLQVEPIEEPAPNLSELTQQPEPTPIANMDVKDPKVVLLVDARNGFNKLSCYAMLRTVWHK